MGSISKDQFLFDPADAAGSDSVGAYVRAGSDGDLVASQVQNSEDWLNTASIPYKADGTGPISNTGDTLDVTIANAGDIEVASNTEYNEDDPSSGGEAGNLVLGVRQDTLATDTSADGDFAWFKFNSLGRLYTETSIMGDIADDAVDTANPLKIGLNSRDAATPLPALSAAGDMANGTSDLYRRMFTNDSPNIGVTSIAETMSAVAALLPSGGEQAGRRDIIIQNTSSSDAVALGGSGVTFASGYLLGKKSSIQLRLGEGAAIYGIADTAKTPALRILEIA